MTQSGFLDASRAAAASSLVLTGLDKLLLGVNPRSGCADHALNIAKFVGYVRQDRYSLDRQFVLKVLYYIF